MLEVPRRPQCLSVALPATFTRDVPHLREKTGRSGLIARSLAIFRVDEVVIFNDETDGSSESEGRLFEKLLAYQETPQYLRKARFKQDPDLQFSGILPPLRMPSHPSVAEPRVGEIREGLVTESGLPSIVNAGFKAPVEVSSKLRLFERVTVRMTRKVVREALNDLTLRWKSSRRPLIVFGSPSQGVPEILAKEGAGLEGVIDFNLNMIPNQGVETVRTEEAVLATMSILNLLEET